MNSHPTPQRMKDVGEWEILDPKFGIRIAGGRVGGIPNSSFLIPHSKR